MIVDFLGNGLCRTDAARRLLRCRHLALPTPSLALLVLDTPRRVLPAFGLPGAVVVGSRSKPGHGGAHAAPPSNGTDGQTLFDVVDVAVLPAYHVRADQIHGGFICLVGRLTEIRNIRGRIALHTDDKSWRYIAGADEDLGDKAHHESYTMFQYDETSLSDDTHVVSFID